MTVAHNVFGACNVLWGTSGAEKLIGFSRDGVTVRVEPRWGDIQSDDYGGEGGVPSDSQFLGATATITAELTKYDEGFVNVGMASLIDVGGVNGTLGIPASSVGIGSLVRGTALHGALVLSTGTTAAPGAGDNQYTFENAFLRGAQEVNRGTKYSTYVASWEAWVDTAAGQLLYTYLETAP